MNRKAFRIGIYEPSLVVVTLITIVCCWLDYVLNDYTQHVGMMRYITHLLLEDYITS